MSKFTISPVVRKRDAAMVAAFFALLYYFTYPSRIANDGNCFLAVINEGNLKDFSYGEMAHFLTIPLLGTIRKLTGLGARPLILVHNFILTISAIVLFGVFCAEFFKSRSVFFVSSLFFGGSLVTWIEWNGELYAGAIFCYSAALVFGYRRRYALSSVFYAISVLCHLSFAFLCLGIFVIWCNRVKGKMSTKLKTSALYSLLAAAVGVIGYFGISALLGKFHSVRGMYDLVSSTFELRQAVTSQPRDLVRATKGLLTAISVAGSFMGDIYMHRIRLASPGEWLAVLSIPMVMIPLVFMIILGLTANRLALLFAAIVVIPIELGFNASCYPSWVEYHQGALIGVAFAFAAGAHALFNGKLALKYRKIPRGTLVGIYLACFIGTNLFGSVLPFKMHSSAMDRRDAGLRKMFVPGKTAIVYCNRDHVPTKREHLIESYAYMPEFSSNIPRLQESVVAWVKNEFKLGNAVYLLGDRCDGEHWQILAKEAKLPSLSDDFTHLDLGFMKTRFKLTQTELGVVPFNYLNMEDSLGLRKGMLYRVEAVDALH